MLEFFPDDRQGLLSPLPITASTISRTHHREIIVADFVAQYHTPAACAEVGAKFQVTKPTVAVAVKVVVAVRQVHFGIGRRGFTAVELYTRKKVGRSHVPKILYIIRVS